jgi:GntR family transcriptional regulator / MocR family aminotransferase
VPLVIPLSKSGESLSRQIYSWLRKSILTADLAPGERLPSTRDLADQLGVSRTVTVLAYEQLLAEGFVEGRAGSGTYVARGLTTSRPAASSRNAHLRLSRYGSIAAAASPVVDFPRKKSSLRYDFAYRTSQVEGFPLETWQRILSRQARRASVQSHNYAPPAGSVALRESIASHLRRSRAVVCEPDQILIVSGSQQALDLAARVLTEPGDRVVIEEPHYQGAREVFRAAGARLHPVNVDREGLNPDRLPNKARLAFLTPSHQFPTGTILPLVRRLALLEWAKKANATIIEDDYDGEFHYEGQPVESMQGLDRDGRVIYVGTFSRTIFPALRIGYLVAPKSLINAFTGAKWLSDRHTPTLEQEVLAEFISSGAYERYLRRARRRYSLRRSALLEAISTSLGNKVSVTGDGSGAHVVLWPKAKVSEDTLIARAASLGVGVYGVSKYYLRARAKPGLLLGYSRMTDAEIREGIRRLSAALDYLRRL